MSTGESTAPVSDIDNMKVPELKKRLKTMGLSTNGNKAELVERLQEAYLGEKDGSLDGGLDDESLEEALLNDDPDQSALTETMIGSEELSFSSPEKESHKTSNIVSKPLKKRAVAPAVETAKPTKPIVLKRDNYPTIEAPKPAAKKDHPLIEPPKADNVTKAEKLTAAERLQMRAKRFNIIDAKISSDSSKAPGAVKIAAVTTEKATSMSKPPIVAPTSVKTEDLDVLRKRAQRFGENVSTVMKQLENQEKLLKRKLKFSGSTTHEVNTNGKALNLSEQERKKKRMERFGL